jgi:hypothetical protein
VAIGVELEPPDEKRKRLIHRPVPNREPGWPKLRLEGETPGRPLGGAPEECEHDEGDKKQLPPENFGRGHGAHMLRTAGPCNDHILRVAGARILAQRSAGQRERSRLRPKLQSINKRRTLTFIGFQHWV